MHDVDPHLEVWEQCTAEELAMVIRDGGLGDIPRIRDFGQRVRAALRLAAEWRMRERAGSFSLVPLSMRRITGPMRLRERRLMVAG